MKQCPWCDEVKDEKEFSTDNRKIDKLNTYCRACCAAKRKDIPREKQREYAKRWKAKNPEKVRLKWQRENAKTGKSRAAAWRRRYPERAKETREHAREKMRKMVADYKQECGCIMCGIRDPRVLDLHHVNGDDKILAVSQMIARCGVEDVRQEIAKCRVLCANCHRIEHYEHMQQKAVI